MLFQGGKKERKKERTHSRGLLPPDVGGVWDDMEEEERLWISLKEKAI